MATTYGEKPDKAAHIVVQVTYCNCGGWAMPATITKVKTTEQAQAPQRSKTIERVTPVAVRR